MVAKNRFHDTTIPITSIPRTLCFDMCAAPGSKTAQLLEFLAGENNLTVPGGMVIANDNDSGVYMYTSSETDQKCWFGCVVP